MDLTVDEFIDGLFSDEAHEKPSDSVRAEDLEMKLPKWFDEKKYNQGRRFYQDFFFMISMSLIPGLIAVLAVPSILKVLTGSRRSSSVYTAYRRYLSTFMHVFTWFSDELKPGSMSWKSLHTVRSRHIQAGRAAKLKDQGIVSQRDVALTLFGFIGFVILKPNRFSVTQLKDGDWEGLNHLVSVVGHMLGLEDRYNICRGTVEETREVCKKILERVYTPCLNNVPEHFEHMTRVMVEGLSSAISLESDTMIYLTKNLADVPGYILTEDDRQALQKKIKKHLKEISPSEGVESTALIHKSVVDGLPKNTRRVLYLNDYESLDSVPAYKNLPIIAKWKLALINIIISIHNTRVGRIYFNYYLKFLLIIAAYVPYIAIWRYGIRKAFVNMFSESPVDDTDPKPNSEFYKPLPPVPWYRLLYDILW